MSTDEQGRRVICPGRCREYIPGEKATDPSGRTFTQCRTCKTWVEDWPHSTEGHPMAADEQGPDTTAEIDHLRALVAHWTERAADYARQVDAARTERDTALAQVEKWQHYQGVAQEIERENDENRWRAEAAEAAVVTARRDALLQAADEFETGNAGLNLHPNVAYIPTWLRARAAVDLPAEADLSRVDNHAFEAKRWHRQTNPDVFELQDSCYVCHRSEAEHSAVESPAQPPTTHEFEGDPGMGLDFPCVHPAAPWRYCGMTRSHPVHVQRGADTPQPQPAEVALRVEIEAEVGELSRARIYRGEALIWAGVQEDCDQPIGGGPTHFHGYDMGPFGKCRQCAGDKRDLRHCVSDEPSAGTSPTTPEERHQFTPGTNPRQFGALDTCGHPFCNQREEHPIHQRGEPQGTQGTAETWPETDVADFLARDRAARAGGRDPHCGLTHDHSPTDRCGGTA